MIVDIKKLEYFTNNAENHVFNISNFVELRLSYFENDVAEIVCAGSELLYQIKYFYKYVFLSGRYTQMIKQWFFNLHVLVLYKCLFHFQACNILILWVSHNFKKWKTETSFPGKRLQYSHLIPCLQGFLKCSASFTVPF